MRNFDFSPLMRAAVGFDRLMNQVDAINRIESAAPSYPPYNIEKAGEDSYRITMAVAGFGEEELDVTLRENSLIVSGRKEEEKADAERYLHRGIATRAFERRFELADHIKVTGARLVNGMLGVDLVREVPEAKRPRRVAINAAGAAAEKVIENKAA